MFDCLISALTAAIIAILLLALAKALAINASDFFAIKMFKVEAIDNLTVGLQPNDFFRFLSCSGVDDRRFGVS